MISTVWQAQNDYSEGCDSILQIVYLLGRNGVKWAPHREGSKISLGNYHCETRGKLVAVMASTITLAENDNSADCDSFFQFGHNLAPNGVKQGFHRQRSKMSLWW